MKKVIFFSCAIICSSFANAKANDLISISAFGIKDSVRLVCEKQENNEKRKLCSEYLISNIKLALNFGEVYGLCAAKGMDETAANSELCINSHVNA
jgi:hypothetical protein